MARRLAKTLVLLAVLTAGSGAPARAGDAPATVDRASIEATVRRLASLDLNGRESVGDREKTSAYVAEQMGKAGLVPLDGQTDFFLPLKSKEGPAGRNVAGRVVGTSPDEVVVIGAHFDGPGPAGSEPRPAADSNASGVAAVLEVGRVVAAGPKPKRSLVVVAFDLAGVSLEGSRSFVADPPFPLTQVAAFLDVERVGRSLGDALPGVLFVLGANRSAGLEAALAAVPASPHANVRSLGMDFGIALSTDAVPFEERKVPTLLLTAGASRDDELPQDQPDKIDYTALAARVRVLQALALALCDAPTRPVWRDATTPSIAEVKTLYDLVVEIGALEESLKWPENRRALRRGFQTILKGFLDRGKVTAGERLSARIMAVQLFTAVATGP